MGFRRWKARSTGFRVEVRGMVKRMQEEKRGRSMGFRR